MADVEPQDAGAASGLVNVAHQLGGSLGTAILTIAYAHAAGTGTTSADLIAGFKAAFAGADVFVVVAVALGIVVALSARGHGGPTARSGRPGRCRSGPALETGPAEGVMSDV